MLTGAIKAATHASPSFQKEKPMNTVVVYDSAFGNTEQIAQAIAQALRAYGQVRTVRVEHTHPLELQGVDLLMVGCPTQKWGATPAMRSMLDSISPTALSRLAIACFDTRLDKPKWVTGSVAQRLDKQLREKGVTRLFPPESFLVKGTQGPLAGGEEERAASWARMLHERVEPSHMAEH
jgi:flavodoxin